MSGGLVRVWAPNAPACVSPAISTTGTARLPDAVDGLVGGWELFVPDVGTGTSYKFEVLGSDGVCGRMRPDCVPHRGAAGDRECRLRVSYEWNDAQWLRQRASLSRTARRCPGTSASRLLATGCSYRELAHQLTDLHPRDRLHTHVSSCRWRSTRSGFVGLPGVRVLRADFALRVARRLPLLVDTLHQAGIGVIVDWVPAHFPKDEFALARFDGTRCTTRRPALGNTPTGERSCSLQRNEVRNFLIANAVYWIEELHIDGLRVDAVASRCSTRLLA